MNIEMVENILNILAGLTGILITYIAFLRIQDFFMEEYFKLSRERGSKPITRKMLVYKFLGGIK